MDVRKQLLWQLVLSTAKLIFLKIIKQNKKNIEKTCLMMLLMKILVNGFGMKQSMRVVEPKFLDHDHQHQVKNNFMECWQRSNVICTSAPLH